MILTLSFVFCLLSLFLPRPLPFVFKESLPFAKKAVGLCLSAFGFAFAFAFCFPREPSAFCFGLYITRQSFVSKESSCPCFQRKPLSFVSKESSFSIIYLPLTLIYDLYCFSTNLKTVI
jgi:hypothetical protein